MNAAVKGFEKLDIMNAQVRHAMDKRIETYRVYPAPSNRRYWERRYDTLVARRAAFERELETIIAEQMS